ncbi:MAG: hypothetical protein EBZ76_09790 [Synechococcaceae bacterium WB9_2_170]|nr:hypothetical protein [Synechococcaceae bacterium WB9_2_170]
MAAPIKSSANERFQTSKTNQPTTTTVRSSQRITITLPTKICEALAQRSQQEGRSLSNLAAFLLESCLTKES